jgi:hypothetical protein
LSSRASPSSTPWKRSSTPAPGISSALSNAGSGLFNKTGEWKYVFARTIDLERDPKDNKYLKSMQKVPQAPKGAWKATLQDVLVLFTEAQA